MFILRIDAHPNISDTSIDRRTSTRHNNHNRYAYMYFDMFVIGKMFPIVFFSLLFCTFVCFANIKPVVRVLEIKCFS